MAKILFIPSAVNEVATMAMVRGELKPDLRNSIFGIALDARLEAQLKQAGFPYLRFPDSQSRTAVDIVRQSKPNLLLADDFSDITRAFIFACAYLGIPSLFVTDGVVSKIARRYGNSWYSPRRLAPRRILTWLKDRQRFNRWRDLMFTYKTLSSISNGLHAMRQMRKEIDHRTPRPYIRGLNYTVAGRYAKEAYIAVGVEPDVIFVTGQPRFDMVFNREFDRTLVASQLGIPQDKRLVVLATQPLGGSVWKEVDQRAFVEIVVEAIPEFPQHQLVIKLHPSEDEKYYQNILAQMGREGPAICRDIDLYQILHDCDLLIAAYSTVALEAMLFGKPVITINLSGKPDVMPYAESGAAIGVYRKEDLIPAMKKALCDPQVREVLAEKRKAFVFEHAYKSDGQASRRVAELIAQLISKRG